MRNYYGSLLEKWKVDLIFDRARRKGFPENDIDDVEQEIVPAILAFRYDPAKANGATEKTALTALIDRRLTFLQRGFARRRKHERRYRRLCGDTPGRPAPEPLDVEPQRRLAIAMDVQQVVRRLSPMEQAVCAGLARQETRRRIAGRLGISRYGLDAHIEGIRQRFQDAGLDGWVAE